MRWTAVLVVALALFFAGLGAGQMLAKTEVYCPTNHAFELTFPIYTGNRFDALDPRERQFYECFVVYDEHGKPLRGRDGRELTAITPTPIGPLAP